METVANQLTELADVRARIGQAISDKGVDVTGTPFNRLDERVAEIPTGGATGWQKDPLWWDILSIINNDPDVANYGSVRISVLRAVETATQFTINSASATAPAKVKTLDGAIITATTTHTWDTAQDKDSSEAGVQTRYIIEYFNSPKISVNVNLYTIYFIQAKGYMSHILGSSSIGGRSWLQSFDFINGADLDPTFITLSYFCSNLASLVRVPYINTTNVTGLFSAFDGSVALREMPLLDTQNCTDFTSIHRLNNRLEQSPTYNTGKGKSFTNAYNGCSQMKLIKLEQLESVTGLANLLTGCFNLQLIELKQVNVALNLSSLLQLTGLQVDHFLFNLQPPTTGTVIITLGATLLSRASTAAKLHATNNNYTLA